LLAPRGVILDRLGRPLAQNSASFKVGKGEEALTRDEALKLIQQGRNVKITAGRDYLYKGAFAHVLGYVGPISEDEVIMPEFSGYAISDIVGKIGLEREYEAQLHGRNGKKLFEVDAQGKFVRELGSESPVPGQNLKTTLDRDIQLAVAVSFKDVERGAVVVSDPRSGAILAMFSKPTFDPNLFILGDTYEAEGDYKTRESILSDTEGLPLLDRAIGGAYPPGSTFKLVTATAALEKGAITPNTQIEDTGILKVGAFSFGNWYFLQYGRTEGSLDIVGAIKRSNDIFFYKAAEGAGVNIISDWANRFGLGKKLGIDLSGEVSGTVPTTEWKEKTIGEQWYLGDTYNYGIGQGYLLTTPLQVNMFTTVFANGGTLYQPHLLQSQKAKVKRQNFINKKNIDLVRQGMMESCETGGVAWPFFNFKVKNPNLTADDRDYIRDASDSADMVRVKVACKTGTAEIGGKDDKPHAWISVFAPFHEPEIVVTVLVENGGEGSSIAGPVARDILKDYFEKK